MNVMAPLGYAVHKQGVANTEVGPTNSTGFHLVSREGLAALQVSDAPFSARFMS